MCIFRLGSGSGFGPFAMENYIWVLNQAIRICLPFVPMMPNKKDMSVQSWYEIMYCHETMYTAVLLYVVVFVKILPSFL